MDRLKILFITNWYPTPEEPAKAVWAREHAKAVKLYDDVHVLHCVGTDLSLKSRWKTEEESNEDLRDGIPTHRVWYRPLPIAKLSYLIYLWGIFRTFQLIVKEGFRPDVIHVHVYDAGGPAILIGRLNRIPVVVTEQFSSFPRALLGRLDLLKARFAFRWANKVLPVSQALQKAIENYGLRAHFQVVPNVADTAIFYPPSSLRTNQPPKRILYVGQLVPVKGIPYLLQALSRLSQSREDWRLDIVGDGVARAEYENLAADLKLSGQVVFQGLRTKREVAEFMRRADLFVLPSLYETFSAPAIEALATGTPVLATRCGGPDDFVTKDVGMLVTPGDAEALCTGLEYMLDHLHLYRSKEISQYAAEQFSPEIVGARLHAVYRSVRFPK
jgi:glycosyltransferase involved in cell wall biosynthesis